MGQGPSSLSFPGPLHLMPLVSRLPSSFSVSGLAVHQIITITVSLIMVIAALITTLVLKTGKDPRPFWLGNRGQWGSLGKHTQRVLASQPHLSSQTRESFLLGGECHTAPALLNPLTFARAALLATQWRGCSLTVLSRWAFPCRAQAQPALLNSLGSR